MAFIEFKNVNKEYMSGNVSVTAVENCSFSIIQGEFVVILGPSGAGKTTVLNLLGGMDNPSGGTITVDSNEIQKYRPYNLQA